MFSVLIPTQNGKVCQQLTFDFQSFGNLLFFILDTPHTKINGTSWLKINGQSDLLVYVIIVMCY